MVLIRNDTVDWIAAANKSAIAKLRVGDMVFIKDFVEIDVSSGANLITELRNRPFTIVDVSNEADYIVTVELVVDNETILKITVPAYGVELDAACYMDAVMRGERE